MVVTRSTSGRRSLQQEDNAGPSSSTVRHDARHEGLDTATSASGAVMTVQSEAILTSAPAVAAVASLVPSPTIGECSKTSSVVSDRSNNTNVPIAASQRSSATLHSASSNRSLAAERRRKQAQEIEDTMKRVEAEETMKAAKSQLDAEMLRARAEYEKLRAKTAIELAKINARERLKLLEESEDEENASYASKQTTSQRVASWLEERNRKSVVNAEKSEPVEENIEFTELQIRPRKQSQTATTCRDHLQSTKSSTIIHNEPTTQQHQVMIHAPPTTHDAQKHTNIAASRSDIAELAAAIISATCNTGNNNKPLLPHRFYSELPLFHGSHQDWLLFRAAYNETAANFTDVENTARLRRNLRGKAKEAVENLLLHYTEPQEIMHTLESRFGRPDAIARTELDRLRKLPKPADTPLDIIVFANKVANSVAALKALGRANYLDNPEVALTLSEKLPSSVRSTWFEYSAKQSSGDPDLVKFSKFIRERADYCAPYAQPEPTAPSHRDNGGEQQRRTHQRTHVTQTRKKDQDSTDCATKAKKTCPSCESTTHKITACPHFKDLDVEKRWELVRDARLCRYCLNPFYSKHKCKSIRCDIDDCGFYHHHLLHKRKNGEPKVESVATAWNKKTSHAYLKIVPITVSGPAGEVKTWALLDDGSTVSLIETDLAERIGVEGRIEPLHIIGIGNAKIDLSVSRRVTITMAGHNKETHRVQLRTIDNLRLSPQTVYGNDLEACHHLKDLRKLLESEGAAPKILIGQDNWHLLIASDIRKGRHDQPVASLTPLGWVIHGTHTRALGRAVNFVSHITTVEESMDEALRRHFAIESLTITPKSPKSDPDQRALDILQRNTTQLPDGHYETALLWKEDDVKMPNNYETAHKRLSLTEKKIAKDPVLAEKYKEQMAALITKGFAELAPQTKTPGRTWYLPHFAVVNALKPGKLRIVHDAAAKTKGRSLNDYLLTGPDLLQSLPGVLMRFRQHPVAVSADIAEMFMQVKIRPEDRDALRYLWREKATDAPTEYRMTSLIFGATSSPATAIFVKNANAEIHRDAYPEAVKAIVHNHYMDDFLASYKTIEETVQISRQIRDIHKQGHFDLRKWTSNSQEVVKKLTNESSSSVVALSDGSNNERVLGLIWKPDTDELAFNLDLARISKEVLERDAPTKREALKILMSLYDPLGIVSPVTIKAKQILQELWRRGTGWDQHIDSDHAEQWREWMKHLRGLRDIAVPRCYLRYTDASTLQLHVFVDASESAYAASLYWRVITPDNQIHVSLALAKARVAPLKLTSIPRLELQAAVMGSRMATAVAEEHDRKPDARYFWTDSTTVLTWLRTGSRSYRPFVAHRIAAIEDNCKVNEWRWIPTKLNVADDATRDVPHDFSKHHRWFIGPEFLHQNENSWPTGRPKLSTVATGEERCITLTTKQSEIGEALPQAERFSKWERYLRSTARVLQFINLCRRTREQMNYKRTRRNKEDDGAWENKNKRTKTKKTAPKKRNEKTPLPRFTEIDAETLRHAERLIWRYSQNESFADEIRELQRGKTVAHASRLRSLSVTYTDGLLQLNSRIANITGVPAIRKSPPLLDGNRHEVKLLIEHIHRTMHHAGVESTINECRQYYWVLRLRPVTKMVIHRCIACRIRKDTPPQPSTGDHPTCRLAHHQRPFTFTGVDYFGPLHTVVGRATQKRYVAIFTCLTTRAIHLELSANLSTNSAVMALRRMVARRGTPTEIWSDNGTNLRGAEKELRKAIDRATEEEASKKTINWRYIPPGAPFMGGAWERLVRSVKTALAATEQSRRPTDEVLATLLAEVEYTVNSRPLTHVSVNAADPEALTPNHFLLGGSARVPNPGTFNDSDLMSRTSWRASQRLADIFWTRWLKEYLPELQHRREPHSRGQAIKVGDIVIIADSNLPRNTWPRGRVTTAYPGKDGITRAVDILTNGGTLRRPVKKLVVIPTQPSTHQAVCSA